MSHESGVQESAATSSAEDAEFYNQLNTILAKTKNFNDADKEDGDAMDEEEKDDPDLNDEARQRNRLITSHTTVSAPLIELLIVNK